MTPKRIIGIILLAASLALLGFYIVPQVSSTFTFTSPRSGYYIQPYEGHALLLIVAIAGCLAAFLAGLLLIGLGRKKR